MRALRRLPEPEPLVESKARWTAAFLEQREKKAGSRPDSRRYAHPAVRKVLAAMSGHKCFYCEQDVTSGAEVDHYIDVAERPNLAFEWTNLYLSCTGCNDKLPNRTCPVAECVDPCGEIDPAEHLMFDGSTVRARAGSLRGQATIRKYDLNRLEVRTLRSQLLEDIALRFLAIEGVADPEARSRMRAALRDVIRSFAAAERPFSRMFADLLARTKIHGGPEAG